VLVGTLLERLAEDPRAAALLLDLDGKLAPNAPAPEQAFVPATTRAELTRLAGSYGLVAWVSGRPAAEVRVAVVSSESPPGLGQAADLVVGDTEELVGLLRRL